MCQASKKDDEKKIPQIRVLLGPQQQSKFTLKGSDEKLDHKKHGCVLIDYEDEYNLRTIQVYKLQNE